MLSLCGITVLEAESVENAAAVARRYEGRIDLAIVNHLLPDGNGRDAITRIREQQPGIRALHYSGYPREKLVRTGSIEEGTAYIQKPFAPDHLRAKLQELLGRPLDQRRTSGGG